MDQLKDMPPFHLLVIGIFAGLAVIGILVLAFYRGGSDRPPEVTLSVWGFMRPTDFNQWIRQTDLKGSDNIELVYQQKDLETFKDELTRGIATDTGPDIFFLPDSHILSYQELTYNIPYDWWPISRFRETFSKHARLYERDQGLAGIPLYADPLVTYWNSRLLAEAGIARPPEYWEDLDSFASRMAVTDGVRVERAAFPLGEYSNVRWAKEIISALIMQAGGEVVWQDAQGQYHSGLGERFDLARAPAESVLAFYTEFSDPLSIRYTWSRTLDDSLRFFAEGNSVLYFGTVSDRRQILDINPNLNLNVRPLPILKEDGRNLVTGEMMALAIPRGQDQREISNAWRAIVLLTGSESVEVFEELFQLPPARTDLLSQPPSDRLYAEEFYDAAIRSLSWLDPDPDETDRILQEMVESVTGGRRSVRESVEWGDRQLRELID